MNKEALKKAKELEQEIAELDTFLFSAERVWTGKLTLRGIMSSALGFLTKLEFKMNTRIKNKVLFVLQDYKKVLEKELLSL